MYIKVKAKTESSKNEIRVKSQDSFEINVRAKPERGEANDAIRFLLAEHLKVHPAKVRLIRGASTRNKIFEILLTEEAAGK